MEPPGLRKNILAANVRSDGNQRIQGGRYFIYRPPRTVSQIPSAPVPARLSPPPTLLTSSAPPRPPSLHLELPKLKANVLLPQRSPSCKASGVSHHKRPCRARRPWRQTFATNCRLRRSGRRRSEWSLTAARVVTCPTPVHGSALGVDFCQYSDHRSSMLACCGMTEPAIESTEQTNHQHRPMNSEVSVDCSVLIFSL